MKIVSCTIVALWMMAALLLLPTTVSAQCETNAFGFCGDCSAGTPCCGYGPCNIFCGNCDGGCRTGPATEGNPQCVGVSNAVDIKKAIDSQSSTAAPAPSAKSPPALTGRALFDSIDSNHDGVISLAETQKWATASKSKLSKKEVRAGFEKADLDHDGKIQPAEFDRSLQPSAESRKAANQH